MQSQFLSRVPQVAVIKIRALVIRINCISALDSFCGGAQPTQVVKTVRFTEQKRLKGCNLHNGKMSVVKVGCNKYRLVVIYGCKKNYDIKLYAVKQSYNLSTNTLTGQSSLPHAPTRLYLLAAL